MTDCKGSDLALGLLYIAAAPLLVLAMTMTLLTSRITRGLFGHDPAVLLVERHQAEWTIIVLTGRCTLGLTIVGILLWWWAI